ncbi:MAG: hypothetical protein Q8Q12_07040 [bacterium]|nr:hypothetical protein [bacterium]
MRPANDRKRRFRPHSVLLPLFFRLRNLKVLEHLAFLQESQFWPRERLEELQLARLRKLVKHASETVPYYREVFARSGITAQDIRTLDDVKRLPILSKEDIVDRPLSAFLSSSGGRPFAVRKTSGTTGHPVTVLVDRDAYAWSIAARYRCEQWHGIRIGDRQARLWGRALDQKGRRLESLRDLTLGRRTINASNMMDASSLRRQVQGLLACSPDYVYAYPSLVLALSEHLKEDSLPRNALHVKAVICTAEKLHGFQKRFLAEVFDCPIVDEYGCSEIDILAFDCERGQKHIVAENVLLEVVKGNDLGAGEVVVTDLNNRLMPLIRYKLGDIGVIAPNPCECGRGLPVLSSICGRTSDQVIMTPDGKRVHSVIFDYFLERLAGMGIGIRQFKAVQERLDRITLYLVVPNEDDRRKTDLLVARDLAPSLGHRVRLETKHVPRIDLFPGKFSCFEAHPSLAGAWRGHTSQEEFTNWDSSQSGER